jgi:cbb3-type cytochrome oxidase subunit 3
MQPEYFPEDETPVLALIFLNGTSYTAETTIFTFYIEELTGGEHVAKFTLAFGDFYDEITLPATVSDGRVYIDSTPTMFVVDPASLIDDNTIQLYQTENLVLSGTVLGDGRVSTLIENYRIFSKVVRASYQTDSDSFFSKPMLSFDHETGVLTHAAGQISDVLLNKLGVAYLLGGIFDLVDYSENLNFTIVRDFISFFELILIPVFVIIFVLVAFFAYRASKKKREKRKKHLNKSLKILYILNKMREELMWTAKL